MLIFQEFVRESISRTTQAKHIEREMCVKRRVLATAPEGDLIITLSCTSQAAVHINPHSYPGSVDMRDQKAWGQHLLLPH